MNQRIRELAEQAVTRFDKDMDGSMEPEEFGQWVRFDDVEKFARLIVEECAKITESCCPSCCYTQTAAKRIRAFATAVAEKVKVGEKNHGRI